MFPRGSFPLRLFELCKAEIAGSGDAKKIIASINVYVNSKQIMAELPLYSLDDSRFCGLIAFHGPVRHKTLERLLILLCHKYPRVYAVYACSSDFRASGSLKGLWVSLRSELPPLISSTSHFLRLTMLSRMVVMTTLWPSWVKLHGECIVMSQ